jgi:hypothetical protein
MESSPVIDYIKKKIYSHPLRCDYSSASIGVFAVSVNCKCPRFPRAESKIILFGTRERNPSRLIRTTHCADCQQEIDKVLPPIKTFTQRHWIVSNIEIRDKPTSACLLERGVNEVADVDVVCNICAAMHMIEYMGLIRKWMLVREIIEVDPGSLIMRAMVNL